ncbi:hypothetical protein AXE65_12350 [Ventosimonas gracilis]|uniref:Minor tail T domain-containing protein n=1 Tax=Ventosimonas gracilis TaxID=1680762 RepID=A0A139SW96_9GAMM|nr:hypothetical protein [Ventosimonas gracilis]KXU38710.1 hypothetical protein AXE65_12350 [Ventosimonas gracilis]
MLGIGGRTVVEAKRRLTYAEFLAWAAYRRKTGTLHAGLRGDRQTALLALTVARIAGSKGLSLYDFLPHEQPPAPQAVDLDQALKEWY